MLRQVTIGLLAFGMLTVPVVDLSYAAPQPVEPKMQSLDVVLESEPRAAPTSPTAEVTQEQTATTLQTEPIEAEPFGLVGATWDEETQTPPVVEVRTSGPDGWGPWAKLPELEAGPDPNTEEGRRAVSTATAPLWVGESDTVQIRVSSPEVPESDDAVPALPDELKLVLVDPGESAADGRVDSRPLASADATTTAPPIISRAQWGADESLRNCGPGYSSTLKAGVLHATAGSNAYATQAQAMQQLRADYAYHTRTLGWCDLGYNFVVDKWGNIYEGRYGGVDQPVVGAHAGGFNEDTFGVAMLGTYTTVEPPAAMQRAVESVFAWKLGMYGVDPEGSTQLTSAGGGTSRYPAGQTVWVRTVAGHRDVGRTEDPGDAGYRTLDTLRRQASALVQQNAVGWFTTNTLGASRADTEFPFGSREMFALACDWDGKGGDSPAGFSGGTWAVRFSHRPGPPDSDFLYGSPGDVPLCGDWDGDGTATPGVYRPSNYTFYLRNSLSSGVADLQRSFGNWGDRPVVGDWDGDGRTTIGVFRPGNVTFYLTNSNTSGVADGAIPLGNPTDVPITGAWTGSRFTTIGVFREGVFYLKYSNFPGPVDRVVGYGDRSDRPVVGDWDGNNTTTPGVVRGSATG